MIPQNADGSRKNVNMLVKITAIQKDGNNRTNRPFKKRKAVVLEVYKSLPDRKPLRIKKVVTAAHPQLKEIGQLIVASNVWGFSLYLIV